MNFGIQVRPPPPPSGECSNIGIFFFSWKVFVRWTINYKVYNSLVVELPMQGLATLYSFCIFIPASCRVERCLFYVYLFVPVSCQVPVKGQSLNQTLNLSQASQACLCKILLVKVKCLTIFVAIQSCLCTNTGGRVNQCKFTL